MFHQLENHVGYCEHRKLRHHFLRILADEKARTIVGRQHVCEIVGNCAPFMRCQNQFVERFEGVDDNKPGPVGENHFQDNLGQLLHAGFPQRHAEVFVEN